MWNSFNKSPGENEIPDHLNEFCSGVVFCCCPRRIDRLLSEKCCGEKIHWARAWVGLSVALCNKSWWLVEPMADRKCCGPHGMCSVLRRDPCLMCWCCAWGAKGLAQSTAPAWEWVCSAILCCSSAHNKLSVLDQARFGCLDPAALLCLQGTKRPLNLLSLAGEAWLYGSVCLRGGWVIRAGNV